MTNKPVVIVDVDRYNELVDNERWTMALEAVGVDNWEGYDEALRLYHQYKQQEESL